MKNSICYSLYVHPGDDYTKRFTTLLYSLHTLFEHNADPTFDVNVFIQGPEILERIIGIKFNKVIINKLDYNFYENDSSYTLSKWYAINKLSNYDKVLFLDCDTIFRRNSEYIFKKYIECDFYGIYDKYLDKDGNNLFWNKQQPVVINGEPLNYNKHVLGFNGINSGQMLFSHRAISILRENEKDLSKNLAYFQSIINNYIQLKCFDEDSIHLSKWINEQFAGQKIIMDNNCTMGEFDPHDISMSPNKNEWFDASITHYISFCNFDIIPDLFVKHIEELKNV